MGETPDMMRDDRDRIDADTRMARANVTSGSETAEDPEQIRNDIEETRADMSETVDAIQERLAPEHLKEQAKEAVRDATVGRAKEAVSNVSDRAQGMMHDVSETGGIVDTIRRNPIPAAMVGVGVGWLWKSRSNGTKSTSRASSTWTGYRSPTDYRDYPPRMDRDDETAEGMRERAGEFTEQAREQAGHLAQEAGHKTQEFGHQAQDQMQQLRHRYDQMMRENPLPLGLAAMGLGLTVGLLVPETPMEDRMMGETRDRMIDQAGEMARETMDKVEQVAEDAKQSAPQSAEQKGLSSR